MCGVVRGTSLWIESAGERTTSWALSQTTMVSGSVCTLLTCTLYERTGKGVGSPRECIRSTPPPQPTLFFPVEWLDKLTPTQLT